MWGAGGPPGLVYSAEEQTRHRDHAEQVHVAAHDETRHGVNSTEMTGDVNRRRSVSPAGPGRAHPEAAPARARLPLLAGSASRRSRGLADRPRVDRPPGMAVVDVSEEASRMIGAAYRDDVGRRCRAYALKRGGTAAMRRAGQGRLRAPPAASAGSQDLGMAPWRGGYRPGVRARHCDLGQVGDGPGHSLIGHPGVGGSGGSKREGSIRGGRERRGGHGNLVPGCAIPACHDALPEFRDPGPGQAIEAQEVPGTYARTRVSAAQRPRLPGTRHRRDRRALARVVILETDPGETARHAGIGDRWQVTSSAGDRDTRGAGRTEAKHQCGHRCHGTQPTAPLSLPPRHDNRESHTQAQLRDFLSFIGLREMSQPAVARPVFRVWTERGNGSA